MPPRRGAHPLARGERGGGGSPSAGCSSAGRGVSPRPCTPERRQAALRRAAERPRPRSRVGAAARPLPPRAGAAGRRRPLAGTASPARARWSRGTPCSRGPASGRAASEAHAYLELAVLVRALQGLSDSARIESAPNRTRSGPASSTCARTSSTAPSTTCARLPPEVPQAVRACFCPASTRRRAHPRPRKAPQPWLRASAIGGAPTDLG